MTRLWGQTDAQRHRLKEESASVGIARSTVEADDGLMLAVWRAGPHPTRTALPTIVLLHGATFSSLCVYDLPVKGAARASYSTIIRLAHAGFPVVAVDLAGYGSSERRNEISTLEQDISDLASVLAHLRSESPSKIVVLGWSWGAQLAAIIASTVAVDGLIFYAGRLQPLANLTAAAGGWPDWRQPTRLMASWDFSTPGNFLPEVRDAFADRVASVETTVPSSALRYLTGSEPLFTPEEITCPVLTIAGSDDSSHDDIDNKTLVERLGSAHVDHVLLETSDHNAHLGERRNAFFAAVELFANGLR